MTKPIRFKLKTLLVVIAFVASLTGWFVDHQRQRREINDLKEHVRRGENILRNLQSHPSWASLDSSLRETHTEKSSRENAAR